MRSRSSSRVVSVSRLIAATEVKACGGQDEGRPLRDMLSDVDDEALYSARTESGTGGMPFNWDDE